MKQQAGHLEAKPRSSCSQEAWKFPSLTSWLELCSEISLLLKMWIICKSISELIKAEYFGVKAFKIWNYFLNLKCLGIANKLTALYSYFSISNSQYIPLKVTRKNNHFPLSREEKARPHSVCSTLSWICLQRRCGASRAENQPRRMCVFEPNYLQMPWEVLAGFVRLQKRDFSQRGCFSKNNKCCYFKLGGWRQYLDRLHKWVLTDWHRTPVSEGSSFQEKQRDLLLMALEVSADELSSSFGLCNVGRNHCLEILNKDRLVMSATQMVLGMKGVRKPWKLLKTWAADTGLNGC